MIMTDFTFTVRKDCITLITAADKKGSVKTTNSGLNIGSRPVGQWQFKTEQARYMLKFDRLTGY